MIDLLILVALLTCMAWVIRFRTVSGVFELSPAPITRTLRVLGIESGHLLILTSLVFAATAVTFFIQEAGSLGIAGVIVTGLATLLCLIGILFLLAARRVRKFEAALPEAVELIKATSRSGGTAQSALTAVAQSTEGILGKEFKWLNQALQHGASIEQATQRLTDLYGTPVVKLFVQALITKWQVGGNLSELMEYVQKLIRTRLKLKLQAQGKLSGARFSGMFVGVLPYTLIPFFLTRDPVWFQILLTNPRGPDFLLMAFLLQILGLFWLLRILRVQL